MLNEVSVIEVTTVVLEECLCPASPRWCEPAFRSIHYELRDDVPECITEPFFRRFHMVHRVLSEADDRFDQLVVHKRQTAFN